MTFFLGCVKSRVSHIRAICSNILYSSSTLSLHDTSTSLLFSNVFDSISASICLMALSMSFMSIRRNASLGMNLSALVQP